MNASASSAPAPIPVTVLTGFLGSGKTTLLNRILNGSHGKKIAVIENEFGDVGVDSQLVLSGSEELFELNNGCLCCSVRGDLIRALNRLLKRRDRLDAVLIETSGLADPGPVAQTFFNDDDMRDNFRLDAIVTLVDARHAALHLDDSPEIKRQIAFADLIILNKTDLADPARLDALEQRLRAINAVAPVRRAANADVPLDQLVNIRGFDLSRATELDPAFLNPARPYEWAGLYDLPAGAHQLVIGHCHHEHGEHPHDHDDHGHDHGTPHEEHHHHHHAPDELDVVILPAPDGAAPAEQAAANVFSDWENNVRPGEPLDPGPVLQRLHLAGGHAHFPLNITQSGPHFVAEACGEHPLHILVNGQPLRPSWQKDYPATHAHSGDIATVALTQPGDIDPAKLNAWLGGLLQRRGADIYRAKGVLSVRGTDRRLVFQSVHMLLDAKLDREWGATPRSNTLVFIGKNLDEPALRRAFQSCLA